MALGLRHLGRGRDQCDCTTCSQPERDKLDPEFRARDVAVSLWRQKGSVP